MYTLVLMFVCVSMRIYGHLDSHISLYLQNYDHVYLRLCVVVHVRLWCGIYLFLF